MLIIGTKGFAKELITTIMQSSLCNELLAFYGDIGEPEGRLFLNKYPIISTYERAEAYIKNTDNRFAIGVGRPALRKKIATELISYGGQLQTIISDKSLVGAIENTINAGVCVMAQCIIETSNTIGEGTLLHVGTFVSHDVTIGAYCEISPYAKLLGNVKIGDLVSIGTGAIILPGIEIGAGAVIGAGSVVTKNVAAGHTVAGVPAKLLMK